MRKMDELLIRLRIVVACAAGEFVDSERGDTNFISMLLIIGIVVVLAGLFLTVGKTAMNMVNNMIQNFFTSLGA